MPGSTEFAGHYPHHYWGTTGAGSLLDLAIPLITLVLLVVLVSAAQWAGRRVGTVRDRYRRPPTGPVPWSGRPLQPPVLASDADRDHATQQIAHAIGEGRLSFDDGGRRIDAALRSRYRHELDRLVGDLPAFAPFAPSRPLPIARWRGVLAGAVALALAALVVQIVVGMWMLWPVAVVAMATAALAVPTRR